MILVINKNEKIFLENFEFKRKQRKFQTLFKMYV